MDKKITAKQRTLIFVNIMISCVASTMLITALTTALPSMVKDLHISVATAQWLTSGYSLVMGIMMPVTAFLITRFPTKKLYLTAIASFIVGLVICSVAPNFTILMIGRIFQACGNGILSSVGQVILLSIYPFEKRGAIMGWYGLSIGAAPVIAPTVSGILVDTTGWRMIFIAAAVIMILSLLFAFAVFDDILTVRRQPFDTLSFLLSGFAFGGITLGIGNIGTSAFVSGAVLLPLVIGLGTASVFVYRQQHLAEPFLDLSVLKNRAFNLSLIGSMLLYLVMMGSSILLPLYIQSLLGYSATLSGLITLPGSLSMAILSPFTGRVYDKFGIKKLFIIGALSLFISNIGMVFITMGMPVAVVGILNALRSISIGCLLMPLVSWGMSGVTKELTAHGTALLTSLRTVAGAIGSAVFVSIMTVVTKNAHRTYGNQAALHGVHVAFLCMSIVTLFLVAIALFTSGTSSQKPVLLVKE